MQAREVTRPRVGRLFGQRKGGACSEVDLLNEANFHRCHLSERMGQKTVNRRGSENNDDEEVEATVHFMGERSDRQNDESA